VTSFLFKAHPIHTDYAGPILWPMFGRLAKIKKRYDPTNLFRVNQNIAPAKH
jgi:FAD/FMN-containing dehydrogenase